MKSTSLWLKLITPIFTLIFFLVSCKKNDTTDISEPKVSSKDPKALSASIKVWHGVRTSGTLPASTGSVLVIDASANPTVKALSGRYAIIKPEIVSGDVDGYYLTINNSGEYFKIDYTKPRIIARTFNTKQKRFDLFHLAGKTAARGGAEDSSIVITLPINIQTPDTFCVTYSPYDAAGNIGQPVTTCIIVDHLGADENSAWMAGDWKTTAEWGSYYYDNQYTGNLAFRTYHDSIIYNRWVPLDSVFCHYDTATNEYQVVFTDCESGSTCRQRDDTYIAQDSAFYKKRNFTLASDGIFKWDSDLTYMLPNMDSSTCQQLKFYLQNDVYNEIGAWSYNSTTNKLTLILEFEFSGNFYTEVFEYNIIKVGNNHFILDNDSGNQPPYYEKSYMRFEK